MEMLKRAQVIMLPTEKEIIQVNDIILNIHDKSELGIVTKHNIFTKESFRFGKYGITFRNNYSHNGFENQHLYIISDDEIKEGDWKYDFKLNIIIKHGSYIDGCKKIIATTDTSLKIFAGKGDICDLYYNLPQPSQQFIEKYIESYNKGNIITDVLIEYESKCNGCGAYPAKNMNYCTYPIGEHDRTLSNFLKINPKDNTITIKKLKNSWNREELEVLFKKHENDVIKYINGSGPTALPSFNDSWIKENL